MRVELLNELTSINGISAHENQVRTYLETNLADYIDEFTYDNLGSLIMKINGNGTGNSMAVIAHMDEVGFIVRSIDEKGFIKFVCVGGVDLNTINNVQVVVNGHVGVIMLKPVNNEFKVELKNFCIDFGFTSSDDAKLAGIKIGDQINFVNNFQTIANNKIIAKSLDDRIGIATLVEIATTIDKTKLAGDLYLCASVQEEVGLRGATTLINKLPNELVDVLIVDVSPITDLYDETSCRVGNGALVRIQDPGMIFNYDIVNRLRDLAETNNIAYQEFFSTGGTDSRVVEVAKAGHKVGAICIPARALHAQNTVASIDDIDAACKLATVYIYDVIGR